MGGYTLKQKNALTANKWAGGSTTELFLHPRGASYAARDFSVRVSSATVEQSPSTFTSLPGFRRILMPLSAPLKLVFDNIGSIENLSEYNLSEYDASAPLVAELAPYEATHFDGGWNTVSHGVCTDIGVMLAAGWDATLEAVHSCVYKCPAGFAAVFPLIDNVTVFAAKETLTLMQGDFLLIELDAPQKLTINVPAKNKAVLIRIWKEE